MAGNIAACVSRKDTRAVTFIEYLAPTMSASKMERRGAVMLISTDRLQARAQRPRRSLNQRVKLKYLYAADAVAGAALRRADTGASTSAGAVTRKHAVTAVAHVYTVGCNAGAARRRTAVGRWADWSVKPHMLQPTPLSMGSTRRWHVAILDA